MENMVFDDSKNLEKNKKKKTIMELNKMVNEKIDEIYRKYETQLIKKYPNPEEREKVKMDWRVKKQIEIYKAFKEEIINEPAEKKRTLGE